MGWFATPDVIEASAFKRSGAWRFFFAALALSYVIVAMLGFGPNILSYHAGRLALSWAAILHGVLMSAWLLLLMTQASLPALRYTHIHRRLGVAIAAFAFLIWISMMAVSVRQILVKHPREGHFLFNILLLQILASVLFPLFVAWAIREIRRPSWHKRLMVFAMVVPLGAAVDRIQWLPMGEAGQWMLFLYLDVLMLPLVIFDVATLRKLHPATAIGLSIVLLSQAAVLALWGTPQWFRLAYSIFS